MKKHKKEDFDLGSFWARKIEGVNNFYFIVVKIRPLDVEFAGFAFDTSGKTGRYFFNWTELLSNHKWNKWEKLS